MFDRGPDDCLPHDVSDYSRFLLAFYLSEIVDLIGAVQRRKDDALLLLHHSITVLLIAVWAIQGRLLWGGVWFNAAHELSDIFLESAKVLKRRQRSAVAQTLSKHLFTVFTLSWLALRVYYIPFCFLPETLRDPNSERVIYRNAVLGLIGLLQVAQAFWTGMILRAAWRQFVGDGRLIDEREHDYADE